jgi:hypothetical protein
MLLDVIQQLLPSVGEIATWGDLQNGVSGQVHIDWSLLAQAKQFDTDVFGGVRQALNQFIQSGQVWALLIGVALGYLLRSMTSYG